MVTSNTYTTSGNYQASSVDENGNPVYYIYNESNGQLNSTAAGNSTQTVNYGYTAMGALKSVSQAVSRVSEGTPPTTTTVNMTAQYGYTDDRISSITHNGFTYNFTYDIWGNQKDIKVGTQSLIAYTYTQDSARNLNTITYGNGNTTSYTYTNGNVTGISYDGGTTFAYTYAYTGDVLTTLTDNISGNVTTYTDDGYEVRKISGNTLIYSSKSNADGNNVENLNGTQYTNVVNASSTDSQTGITTDSSTVTSTNVSLETGRTTDGFERAKTKTFKHKNSSGTTLGSLTASLYYEDDAYLSSLGLTPVTNLSTQVAAYSNQYTANNQVTAKNTYTYEYDAKGNITRVCDITFDANNNPVTTEKYRYTYDEASQLIREDNAVENETYTYTYDVGGNIVSKNVYAYTIGTLGTPTDTINYGYSTTWKDLMTSYDGSTITYDNIGNPTSYLGATLTWQGRQLKSYTKGTAKYEFTYDADGLRTSQKFYTNNVLQKTYQYIWKDGALAGQIMTASGTTTTVKYIYNESGEPQGFVYNGTEIIYYMKDAQGNVTALIDSDTGGVVATYLYDAWGNVTYSASNSVGTAMLAVNAITYRGYCFDKESGLYYLQSRYYDSTTGRFLNTDDTNVLLASKGTLVGINLFAYCSNNPVMNIDPNGMWKIPLWWLPYAIDIALIVIPALVTINTILKNGRLAVGIFERSSTAFAKFLAKVLVKKLGKTGALIVAEVMGSIVEVIKVFSCISIGFLVTYVIDCLDGKYDKKLNTSAHLRFRLIWPW